MERAVANEGAVAVIVGRNDEDNRATAESIIGGGAKAFPIRAELTRTEDSQSAVEAALAEFGRIDGLCPRRSRRWSHRGRCM
ncbi:MAG: SDR family NAD(P)-dependent oxidoreductase [Fimbriimonadales bacterium]